MIDNKEIPFWAGIRLLFALHLGGGIIGLNTPLFAVLYRYPTKGWIYASPEFRRRGWVFGWMPANWRFQYREGDLMYRHNFDLRRPVEAR